MIDDYNDMMNSQDQMFGMEDPYMSGNFDNPLLNEQFNNQDFYFGADEEEEDVIVVTATPLVDFVLSSLTPPEWLDPNAV